MDRNIGTDRFGLQAWRVALRKESVDRNLVAPVLAVGSAWSLSARRAWIEMREKLGLSLLTYHVALRKESVDRNIFPPVDTSSVKGRSPQGERG